MHLDLSVMQAGLGEIRRSPSDAGTVELIVGRPVEGERVLLDEARIDLAVGLVGDRWSTGTADLDAQVTVMNVRSIALIADTRDRWPLAGDQLYVDLDLSPANLPPGSRVQVGTAVLEVSPKPHRGCKKFGARFGLDALRFVNSETGYELNLRGVNTRVVQPGVIRTGDVIRKLDQV
jgi:MOSC domain-containing protein YiiM